MKFLNSRFHGAETLGITFDSAAQHIEDIAYAGEVWAQAGEYSPVEVSVEFARKMAADYDISDEAAESVPFLRRWLLR